MILKSKNFKELAKILTAHSERELAIIENDPIVQERRRILRATEALYIKN